MEVVSLYKVIVNIIGIIITIFTGYSLTLYYDYFMEKKKIVGKYSSYIFITVYAVIDYCLDYFFKTDFETKITIWKLLLYLIAVFVLGVIFYKTRIQIHFMFAIIFVAIKDICTFISTIIVIYGGKIFDLWVMLLQEGKITAQTTEHLINITASVLQIIMAIVYIFIFAKSIKSVIKNYENKEYQMGKEELLFLLTPSCVGFLLCVLIRTIFISIDNGIPQDIYDKYPILLFVVPAIMILSLLSIIFGIKLFQNMIRLNKEKSDRVILEKQIENMQDHITEVEHIYSGLRSMKHDMKNTISVITQLVLNSENNSNMQLQNYIAELNKTMDRLDLKYKTGNSVIDILLNTKYHEMIRSMPDIKLNLDGLLLMKNIRIQSYDMGIIIGNALDNAIEACQKLREKDKSADLFITLSSFIRGKMFFIEVENSFDGIITRKKYCEFPLTDKKDKKAHGIGLSNIKNTAEKYHGGVDWSVENKKFTLTVMLQNAKY